MPRTKQKNQGQSREYETIELRFRPAQFRRVKRAAELKGISVSEFIASTISSADAAAVRIIDSAKSAATP